MAVWIGDPPELCAICEREIESEFFHDGWASICRTCFEALEPILEVALYVKRQLGPHTVWEECHDWPIKEGGDGARQNPPTVS